jgi:hypothetical protein
LGYAFAWVLSAIAVIKTAETQRKIKRIISAVRVLVHFSEVHFVPFRLYKNRRDTKKNQESNFCGSSAGAFLRSSLRHFAVIKTAETQRKIKRIISAVRVQVHFSEVHFAPLWFYKNRRDAKKNQENNFCGSSAGAFLGSSLRPFSVI